MTGIVRTRSPAAVMPAGGFTSSPMTAPGTMLVGDVVALPMKSGRSNPPLAFTGPMDRPAASEWWTAPISSSRASAACFWAIVESLSERMARFIRNSPAW